MEEGKEILNRKISRRKFLKLAGSAAAGAAVGYAAWTLGLKPNSREVARSPEIELKPSVKVLDFFDLDKAKDKFLKDNFAVDFSEEKAWQDMGVTDPSTKEGLLKVVPKNENQTKLLMIALFINQHQNHGKDVISVIEKISNYLSPGQTIIPEHASIAEAVKFRRLEYDEIGNPTLHVMVSPEIIDKLVSQSSEDIINMSFEVGEFLLTYSLYDRRPKYPEMGRRYPSKNTINEKIIYKDYLGNEITENEYNEIMKKIEETEIVQFEPNNRDVKFLDGYTGDKTYQNLQKLTDIARNHPEKMFIAAGGNPVLLRGLRIPDIRQAREKLTKQGLWPENLIIVGLEGMESGVVGPASYGADVYVSYKDLEKLGFSQASSFATPVITEVVRQLVTKGSKTPAQAKESLRQLTQVAEDLQGSEKIEYQLLYLDKAKNSLSSPK